MIKFKGLIAPTEVPTGDGRMFAAGKMTHRPLPLPLMAQFGSGGHSGAVPVAKMESIEPGPGGYWAQGYFLDPAFVPEVPKAIYMLQEKVMGPSVDLDRDYTVKAVPHPTRPDKKAAMFEEYNVIGATLVPMPAFHQVHMNVETEQEKSLLASAGVDLTQFLDDEEYAVATGIEQILGAGEWSNFDMYPEPAMQIMDVGSQLPFTIPGITEGNSKMLIDLLQPLLARLIKLHMTIKHTHWNVDGPQFIAVHKMLDKLAAVAQAHVDTVAERIATFGGSPNGTVRGLVHAVGLDEDCPTGRVGMAAYLSYLNHCYTETITKERDLLGTTGVLDVVTQDMLTGHLQELEKNQWFIRAEIGC